MWIAQLVSWRFEGWKLPRRPKIMSISARGRTYPPTKLINQYIRWKLIEALNQNSGHAPFVFFWRVVPPVENLRRYKDFAKHTQGTDGKKSAKLAVASSLSLRPDGRRAVIEHHELRCGLWESKRLVGFTLRTWKRTEVRRACACRRNTKSWSAEPHTVRKTRAASYWPRDTLLA